MGAVFVLPSYTVEHAVDGLCTACFHLQVWLAEWMGTQVAAKELLCLTDKAKDDAARKRRERGKDGADDGASDAGSDDRWAATASMHTYLADCVPAAWLEGCTTG